MAGNVKYSKEMREYAKQNSMHLVTIAVPGFEFQGPVTNEMKKEALEMATRWLTERTKKK